MKHFAHAESAIQMLSIIINNAAVIAVNSSEKTIVFACVCICVVLCDDQSSVEGVLVLPLFHLFEMSSGD